MRSLVAFLLCFTQACAVVEDHAPRTAATGTLIVDWSINGFKDAEQCDQGDADAVHIAVINAAGVVLAEYEQSCSAFATTIELEPGEYAADIVLVDPEGLVRTTSVRVRPFTINDAEQLEIPVDFPASSFY